MKFFKKISLFVFIFLFCWLLQFNIAGADNSKTIDAPIILSADLVSPHVQWGRPIVIGLVANNKEVLVYVDGNFSGVAKINKSKTETNNFYYQPVLPLTPGKHTVFTVAKDLKTKTLSDFSASKTIEVAPLVAPTVFKPNENTVTGNNKPLISGLTKSGTRVLVYIDGVYNGKTGVASHNSGVAGFIYKPFLNLNVGRHTYFAISETANGTRGAQSRIVTFNIEKKYPAPTLINLKLGKKLITGLAKNGSKVRIYLDNKIDGEFKVVNHKSGTANFAYTLQKPLTNGAHMVYSVAIDSRGKESAWSNSKTINIIPVVKNPVITKNAASEEKADNKTNDKKSKNESKVDKNPAVNTITSASTTEIKATGTGLIDEGQNSQSKLKLNLAVFILFLLALIAWIFWVNRELIKEKREKDNAGEEKTDGSSVEKK